MLARFFSTAFGKLWSVSLAIKLLFAYLVPFVSDEAYYRVWSFFPNWSYFDHPPWVAWLFWLGRHLDMGGQSSRWPAVILAHFSFLIWREILLPYLSDRELAWWMLMLALSPLLGAGGIIVTPDLPLIFFWSLSLYFFRKAYFEPKLKWYLALGIALGLGFCAKYHIALFVPAAILFLLARKRWRHIRWPWVPAVIVMAAIFSFPVVWWNYQNQWASFAFQLHHGFDGGEFLWNWPAEYAGGQIALIFPFLLYLFFLRPKTPALQELKSELLPFAWVPPFVFLISSFTANVEANWPIAAYPAIYTIAFINRRGERLFRATLWVWFAAWILVGSEVFFPWAPIPSDWIKTNEVLKFDPLLPEFARDPLLLANSYQMAAAISYRQKSLVYKLAGMSRYDFYDFLPESRPKTTHFYFAAEKNNILPEPWQHSGYKIISKRDVNDRFVVFEVKKIEAPDNN